MKPILIILLAAAASVPLGLWLRRNLATLSYRNAREADLPEPGPRWWIVWTSAIVFVSLACAAAVSHNPLTYLPLVPLAATGPWLAAVDFDVLRIPNRVLLLSASTSVVTIVGLAAAAQDWRTLIAPFVAAVVTGGVFAVVHFSTEGGVGFGDVKLAAVIGLAAGPLGVEAVWLSIAAGSLTALVWAKISRWDGPIPFGPWLLSGAWVASLASVMEGG